MNAQAMDIRCERNYIQSIQGTDSCLQDGDGDHTAGHYITFFAEQLTRNSKVLVPGQE